MTKKSELLLSDLAATCARIAKLEAEAANLRIVRDEQFETITRSNTYTVPAIVSALGVSKSRHTQMLRAMRDRDEAKKVNA